MPHPLDEQLLKLCSTHDLTSISVGFIVDADREPLANVSVQGGGKCVLAGHYGQPIGEALTEALTQLAAERLAAVNVPVLEAA